MLECLRSVLALFRRFVEVLCGIVESIQARRQSISAAGDRNFLFRVLLGFLKYAFGCFVEFVLRVDLYWVLRFLQGKKLRGTIWEAAARVARFLRLGFHQRLEG